MLTPVVCCSFLCYPCSFFQDFIKCYISTLGFFGLDIKRDTPKRRRKWREKKEKWGKLDKNGEESYIKTQYVKEETNCLFADSQVPEIFPILMVLDNMLRRDGPSSCEKTASYQNRKEKYNLLAIPEHSTEKWREKTPGTNWWHFALAFHSRHDFNERVCVHYMAQETLLPLHKVVVIFRSTQVL